MKTAKHMISFVAALILTAGAAQEAYAQTWRQKSAGKEVVKVRKNQPGTELGEVMEYVIEDGDTIFVDEIRASKVYSRLPKQKGKEWRKYYRLVHNFSKAYPYALVAKKLVMEADSTIAADNLKRVKREKYINEVQKELFERLRKSGEKKIYYIKAEGLLGDDGEATVDGTHFTDLGATRYVNNILPVLRKALKRR